jgi:hypothetical protein
VTIDERLALDARRACQQIVDHTLDFGAVRLDEHHGVRRHR